jgi:hypothetical protein
MYIAISLLIYWFLQGYVAILICTDVFLYAQRPSVREEEAISPSLHLSFTLCSGSTFGIRNVPVHIQVPITLFAQGSYGYISILYLGQAVATGQFLTYGDSSLR